MKALVAAHDWSSTPLGGRDAWPAALRSAVDLMLDSRHAMCLAWGPSLTFLYNDAYSAFLGRRHPSALGCDMQDVWADVWPDIAPLVASALAGEATWGEDLHLAMERNGYAEDTWWTFCYSPLRDADGIVHGLLDIAVDTSARVRGEQRQRFHAGLETALRDLVDPHEVQAAAARLLGRHLGAQRVVYAEDGGDGETVVVTHNYVDGVAGIEGRYRYADYGAFLLREMRAGRAVVRDDVAADPALSDAERGAYAALGIGATLNVPLVKEGRLVAILAVHYRHPHPFRDGEVALAADVAERTWAAVERARAQQALRDSETRYRTLFEAVDAGFAVVEMKFDAGGTAIDYRFIDVNPAFEKQSGLVGARGRWVSEMLPELEQHWFDTYGQVARTGEPVQFENGSEIMGRWFEVHAFRTEDPAQQRVAILFKDVSARRAAEQRLRTLNEDLEHEVAERTAELRRFRDVIEATVSPICAFDADHRVIALNRAQRDAFLRVFGYRLRVGDSMVSAMPADQVADMRPLLDRALAGETFTVVREFGDPAREKPAWEITYTPLRDGDGTVIGAFHMAIDITARLHAEAELGAAQEALRQSQKMEAMGSLTGGVAHDFNNLLTPIVGSLDLLQRRKLGGEREQRLIAGAVQSAERARMLVQRLLAFARRQPLQPKPVDVGALVAGMADLVASTSGPRTQVTVDVADGLPPAVADPNQLEMAILNLSVNARDAMPEGGRLTMSAQAQHLGPGNPAGVDAGKYVCLSVTDTGAGMDADTLKRAIEPFFSTKGIGKGTGLGLSMVHGLAAQLGGGLTIDSRPDRGTSVRLWLPATVGGSAIALPAPLDPAAHVASGRALVVDDERIVRATTADMMTELGYDVTEAGSAEEALRLLDGGFVPDILVTDHLMPGMNGTDLVRAMRRRHPALRALIVSGYAEVEGVAPDLPRLVKPFRQADLAAALAAAMRSQSMTT